MGGRDHSCEVCGRGGFNDPDGICNCTQADYDLVMAREILSDAYWAIEWADEGHSGDLLERIREFLGWPEPEPPKFTHRIVMRGDSR